MPLPQSAVVAEQMLEMNRLAGALCMSRSGFEPRTFIPIEQARRYWYCAGRPLVVCLLSWWQSSCGRLDRHVHSSDTNRGYRKGGFLVFSNIIQVDIVSNREGGED